MSKVNKTLQSSQNRRIPLLNLMGELGKGNKNCYSCSGKCCSYAHNSMQVTPAELIDLYHFLLQENRININLVDDLKKCIKDYRLDHEVSLGRGKVLRRHYTCPFFNSGPKGCSIDPESKPYGCLGFNPFRENVQAEDEDGCQSYLEVLEDRERAYDGENELNNELKEEFQLYWDKRAMPVALLELIMKLHKSLEK